jgi:hypothetical protein
MTDKPNKKLTFTQYKQKLLELELKPINSLKDNIKFNKDRDKLLCKFNGWVQNKDGTVK